MDALWVEVTGSVNAKVMSAVLGSTVVATVDVSASEGFKICGSDVTICGSEVVICNAEVIICGSVGENCSSIVVNSDSVVNSDPDV